MRVTLDRNCMIALETGEPDAACLRRLVAAHEAGRLTLCMPAISASEKPRDGAYLDSFEQFACRLAALSSRPLELLHPFGVWGITFYGHCIYGSEQMTRKAEQIHAVLFRNMPFEWQPCVGVGTEDETEDRLTAAVQKEQKKWRNRMCDTMGLWCHIYHGSDHFVSGDERFHKTTKKPELLNLGARSILRPVEAVALLQGTHILG